MGFNPLPGIYNPGGFEGNNPISNWGGQTFVGDARFSHGRSGDYLGNDRITQQGGTTYVGMDKLTQGPGGTWYRGNTPIYPK